MQFLAGVEFSFLTKIMISAIVLNKAERLILTSVNLPQLFKPQTLKMLLQHTDVWSCFLRMMIFCLFLCVLLYSQHDHCSHICPKNCICEQATAVHCFRGRLKQPEENTPGIQSSQRAEGPFFFFETLLMFYLLFGIKTFI